MSRDSSSRLQSWFRRIEKHESDRRPVTSATTPALRIRSASALIEFVTPGEDVVFAAAMAFIRCYEADRAVSMLAVIPADNRSTHRRAAGASANGTGGYAAVYFKVWKRDSEYGLSLET